MSWLDDILGQAGDWEAAAADQNGFNRDIQTGQLDVQRGNLGVAKQNAKTAATSAKGQIEIGKTNAKTARYSAETGRFSAEADKAYKEGLIEQAKKELEFKYFQQNQNYQTDQGKLGLSTLELGAGLKGPRNWDTYLETASQAGQNPLLQQAMGSWAQLTGNHPNTGAVNGPLPQKFDLNALASDFMGGGVSGPAQRNTALDTVAMTPGQAAPGWWQGLSGDEQERAKGYWETHGWSPDSVLNSLSYTQGNQGLSYAPSSY
jgi:hypothetical protein